MATILSNPVNLLVQSPTTVVRDWGSGTQTGAMSGDLWTPGRDANGVVNLASWNIVPKQRWIQVAGSRLDGLDAAVKAAIPAWRDWGVEGWNGVTDDWCGMATDTAASRMWLFGGGHAGSSNNGIYRFDALRMAWAIEDLPSDPTPWSSAYANSRSGGTYTICPESDAAMKSKQSAGTLQAVNDWFYDELFWDRKPTSRHTYSSMVYAPETNELIMICRRLWRYSLTERRWTYKRLIRDQAAQWLDGEDMVAIYDEVKREVLVSAAGSSGIYNATGYSLTNNTWTNWGSPWNLYSGIADVRVGRRVVVVQPGAQRTIYNNAPSLYWDYDLDTRSLRASGQFQYGGGLTQNDFARDDWWYDSAALTYLPSRNRFWLFTLMFTGGMTLLEINPTTTPWTISRAPAMPGTLPTMGNNMERKMIYLPQLDAVIICNHANENLSLYRV